MKSTPGREALLRRARALHDKGLTWDEVAFELGYQEGSAIRHAVAVSLHRCKANRLELEREKAS